MPLTEVSAALGGEKANPPGLVGVDDRAPLDSEAWPWRAIGRINHAGWSSRTFCTGALVAPDAVLTAAHCLFHLRGGAAAAPASLRFLAGYRRGAFVADGVGASVVTGAGPERPSRPDLERIAADWAVVRLAAPLQIQPIPIAAGADVDVGTTVTRAGYGMDRPHLLSVHAGCRVERAWLPLPVLLTDCDATHGDSGSPLLAFDGGNARIVGMVSAVREHGPEVGTYAVAASAFADWRARR